MIHTRRLILSAVLAALVSPAAASGQLAPEAAVTTRAPLRLPVLAEVSVRPHDIQGALDGVVFMIPMNAVDFAGRVLPVTLERSRRSTVGVRDVQPRANGTYLVRFTVPWINEAGQLRIRRGGPQGPVLASCSMAADLSYNSVEQQCEAQFNVTDGRIDVLLEIENGYQAGVSRITLQRMP